MRPSLAIARTGVEAVLLHRLRSAVTVGCLVAILLPFVAGLGVSRGLRDQADDAVRFGADLYVSGRRLGREAPLPASVADWIRTLPGVARAVPRITAGVRLGAEHVDAVLVGLPADALPATTSIVRGRSFRDATGELVVGAQLARRLALDVGSKVPPFYRNDAGERVSTVVGVFDTDAPVWSANLLFASLDTASTVLATKDLVTSVLVWCAPGAIDDVRSAIAHRASLAPPDEQGPLAPRVIARDDLEALLAQGLLHREGVFAVHWLLAFALAIPLVLLTTGLGLAERRREAGLLKAGGWQTDEVVLRALVESAVLCAAGTSIAILLAFVWLGPLHGAGVASVFLAGVDAVPDVAIPFRLTPGPASLCALLAFIVVTTGSVGSAWRAAAASPAECLR